MTKRVSLIQMLEKLIGYFTSLSLYSSSKKKICKLYQQITLNAKGLDVVKSAIRARQWSIN